MIIFPDRVVLYVSVHAVIYGIVFDVQRVGWSMLLDWFGSVDR